MMCFPSALHFPPFSAANSSSIPLSSPPVSTFPPPCSLAAFHGTLRWSSSSSGLSARALHSLLSHPGPNPVSTGPPSQSRFLCFPYRLLYKALRRGPGGVQSIMRIVLDLFAVALQATAHKLLVFLVHCFITKDASDALWQPIGGPRGRVCRCQRLRLPFRLHGTDATEHGPVGLEGGR